MSSHLNTNAAGAESATRAYFDHSSAERVNTHAVLLKALKKQYPGLDVVVASTYDVNLLAYAAAGLASATPVAEENGENLPSQVTFTTYMPPARRIDGSTGAIGEALAFGKFVYTWKDTEFILYVSNYSDSAYPPMGLNSYLLTSDRQKADTLILEAGRWGSDLHEQVWVFDQGYWQKDSEMFHSIIKSTWDSVILDEGMKKAIIDDHNSFFDARETYRDLSIPWKRGIIYYGPPGNGKTISIKATMHMLFNRTPSVSTLYVRSLVSYMGPEYGIKLIFNKAREFAPCYLVLEDLDTIITPSVRSYFLNEVDGLKNNDGIFIIGSTNHLDRLDPGIAKRPSRFDRKYFFPDPNLEQRIAYAKFWQSKLADNKSIEFPDSLCEAIAKITDEFSFAYMQEAFVAALLAIARRSKEGEGGGEDAKMLMETDDGWTSVGSVDGDDDQGLDELVLWVEIQKQIEILREGMKEETSAQKASE